MDFWIVILVNLFCLPIGTVLLAVGKEGAAFLMLGIDIAVLIYFMPQQNWFFI